MDLEAYRRAFFVDPPPEPRFAFTGAFGATLYVEDFDEAVAFYAAALGPPAYAEGEGTRGWPIGAGWLTLLRGADGNPRNVELTIEVATVAEAERLQAAFVAAGGRGSPPSDQLMYRPVRTCPVADPFGTELMIVAHEPHHRAA
jgi:catechol 2,3-dioxygenase-like lactoylglutathione lyase family enzyme